MRLIYLFFKQGFKSVFTYKIQFFVVIFLAFFASFYLATAMSLTQRLNQAYDNVVGEYEKFDYTYNRKMNESNLMSTNTTFLPILDFLPTQLNSAKFEMDGDSIVLNDSFNIVLNSFNNFATTEERKFLDEAGYTETFITKTFFDNQGNVQDRFKTAWDMSSGALTDDFWSSFGQLFINGNQGRDEYKGLLLDFNFSKTKDEIAEDSTATGTMKSDSTDFVKHTTNLLVESLWNELNAFQQNQEDPNTKYLNDTLIGKYMLDGGFILQDDGSGEMIFNKPSSDFNFDYANAQLSEIEVYIYNALETIPYFLLDKIRAFMTSSYAEMLQIVPKTWGGEKPPYTHELAKGWVEEFNKQAEEHHLIKLSFASIENEQAVAAGEGEKNLKYNINLAFEYIFGQSLNSTKTDLKNEILNPYLVTSLEDIYGVKIENDDIPTTINEKYKYANISIIPDGEKFTLTGLRGSANPMAISQREKDEEIISGSLEARSSSMLLPWEKLAKGQTFSSEFGGKKYDDSKLEYKTKNIFNLNLFHERMIADYTGIELNLREEAFLYDQNTKTNIRFVVVDPRYDYNYTIMAGTEAMSDSEIVISQQYAFKNGYEIGDTIKIGAGEPMVISGFGSDVLTYYPLVDPEVPVSDVSNSLIAYVPKTVLRSIISKGNPNDFQSSTYYFIKNDNSKSGDLKTKLGLYDSLLMNDKKNLNKMYDTSKSNISIDDIKSVNNIKEFEDTTFDLNWELQPKLIGVINIICIVSSVFILIMAFVAIVFAIKKSIDHNASQIGYLKAIGSSAYKISVSYITYALLIGLIIVPFAWLSAGFFQEVLSQIFSTYFSSTLYEFIFDPKMLGILMAVFGIGALVFSYLVALYLTGRNVLKIINHNTAVKNYRYTLPWLRTKIDKLSFKVRFPMHISGRGWKQVLMITSTSFIVTIVVSLAMAIPSVLTNYIDDATKYFSYKNAYNLNEPVVNMPVSRPGISSSRGIPTTEENYKISNELKEKNVSDLFFEDIRNYNDSNWDTSFFPAIMMNQDNTFSWFEQWALKNGAESGNGKADGNTASDNFLLAFIQSFATKIPNLNGVSFSAGTFERVANWFWSTDVDPQTGKKYDTNAWNQYSLKKEEVKNNSAFFNELIPSLVKLLQGTLEDEGIDFEVPDDASWKEQIILLAMAFLPSTGQQYLKDSPNRASQFTIGINVENYTPGVESLSTVVDGVINSNDQITINGLKDNQMAYHLDEINNTEDVFITDGQVLTELETLFNTNGKGIDHDIKMSNGFVLYENNTKTLTIPTITNLKSNDVYGFGSDLELKNLNRNVLKFGQSSNDEQVIPTNAWVYDNRELTTKNEANGTSDSLTAQGDLLNSNNQLEWIPATEIDSNKLTYSRQFITEDSTRPTANKELNSDSQWFIKTDFLDNNISEESLTYELRPYYHYNNLKLFIPKEYQADLLTKGRFSHMEKYTNSEFNGEWQYNSQYWGGEIKNSAVPEIVKQAWGNYDDTTEWLWVAPFSINYGNRSGATNDGSVGNILTEIDDIYIWADEGISRQGTPLIISNDDVTFATPGNKTPTFDFNVELRSVATLDTFNGNIVIVDQDILNLLTDRSISKYIPMDYDFYGDQVNTLTTEDGLSIPVYKTLTPKEVLDNSRETKDFFMKEELIEQGFEDPILYAAQNRDFTTKYSAYEEAFGVTTGFKGVLSETPGVFPVKTVKDMDIISGLGMTYNNIELAGSELGMIISISESILMVSIFLIIGIILIAVLIITIMADVYIMKYSKFIITMKALGYKNKDIILSSLAIPTVISAILMFGGYFIGVMLLGQGLQLAYGIGIYIPLVLHWWVPVAVLALVFTMYILSCLFSLQKPMKTKLTSLT